jgi:hypothetical protein
LKAEEKPCILDQNLLKQIFLVAKGSPAAMGNEAMDQMSAYLPGSHVQDGCSDTEQGQRDLTDFDWAWVGFAAGLFTGLAIGVYVGIHRPDMRIGNQVQPLNLSTPQP